MLGLPASTLRRYSVQYAQHLSERASSTAKKRHYTDEDILILKRVRELVSQKKSPDEITALLSIQVVDNEYHDGTQSALALLPDVAQAFEDIRSLLAKERQEREQLANRLEALESWLQTPWYRKIGKKPPTK